MKQVCFGIFDKDGNMHMSESCICEHAEVLEDELSYLKEHDPDRKWRVRPMYILTHDRSNSAPENK